MGTAIFSVFVLLHGLAHMVYTAMARGVIPRGEQPDITGASWLLVEPLGVQGTRNVGVIVFTGLTLVFAVVAGGLAFRQAWSPQGLATVSFLSSLALLIFWDGSLEDLASKGLVGLLINIGLLIGLYVFKYPTF